MARLLSEANVASDPRARTRFMYIRCHTWQLHHMHALWYACVIRSIALYLRTTGIFDQAPALGRRTSNVLKVGILTLGHGWWWSPGGGWDWLGLSSVRFVRFVRSARFLRGARRDPVLAFAFGPPPSTVVGWRGEERGADTCQKRSRLRARKETRKQFLTRALGETHTHTLGAEGVLLSRSRIQLYTGHNTSPPNLRF